MNKFKVNTIGRAIKTRYYISVTTTRTIKRHNRNMPWL